jgi:vacuolar-type H+-ATPase subunit F/Vma7
LINRFHKKNRIQKISFEREVILENTMSKLIILTRPYLTTGFRIAGVESYGVETFAEAAQLVSKWLIEDIQALIAIDEDFFQLFEPSLKKRLEQSERLYCVAIPSGVYQHIPGGGHHGVSEMIRQAIGIHITFEG